jgi:hypothetical protein
MQFDLTSTIIGFLVGGASGAVGGYYANKYTDYRRKDDAKHQEKKDFLTTRDQMPEFITELKKDLIENPDIREFFVLQERACLGGSSIPRFIYRCNDSNNLLNKMQILENKGYIQDVSPGNASLFRMTEEFVTLVKKYG